MSKKIMLWSVSPKISTGYGMGTKSILKILVKLGHDVIVQSSYGNYSYEDNIQIEDKNIRILPALNSKKYGSDVIYQNIQLEKPDAILQFFDIFAMDNIEQITKMCPMASLLMIDSTPYQTINNYQLKYIKQPVCVIKNALKEIKIKTIQEPIYCPLPISRDYYMEDKIKSRNHFNQLICKGENTIVDDTILITVVSNNCGDCISARKNILNIIRAWSKINKEIPNAKLYLHMDISGKYSGGIDIGQFITNNIPKEDIDNYFKNVLFPSPLKYSQSKYTQDDLRYIYNSSDIYLNPSLSEGFGMPLVESMSCGVVPLATNFLATKELIENCVSNPKDNLLDGTLIDIGFEGRRMHVTEDEISNKTINLIKNLKNYNRLDISTKAKLNYCEDNLLESYDNVIRRALNAQ